MALDPMIARGVQPIEIGNTLMKIGAMKQRDESLAQDAKYQNALMQDRQEDRTQRQNAFAEEEKKRRREAAEPMLAEALRSGDPAARMRALEMGRQFAIEVNPQLAQFPSDQLDQFIEKGLTEKYAKQFTPGQTRTRIVGGSQIQEEFDSSTGKWSEIGRGSRWAPQSGGSTQAPAPSLTEIVDPTDPTRMLRVDARLYRGGSLGSPGVFGVSGKEPSAAKRDEQRGTSRQAVDELVATLRDQFTQLNEGGGITNTDSGLLGNVGAGIASSGPGQAVGKLAGTKNQSMRNQIQQTRPRLLSAVMAATGMSARQLDSNAELKLWLSAATDPTLDYQANMEALNNILNLYGTGGALSGGGEPPSGQPPAASGGPEPGTVENGYLFIGGDPSDPKRWVKTRPDNYP
jgi:hypothetical protein